MKSRSKQVTVQAGKVGVDSAFYTLIQRAYRVFNQGPTEHAVCDCCMCPKIRRDFFNQKQCDIPLHYIHEWFFAAADNPMQRAAWCYVLPRILEILACGDEPSHLGIEISLNRYETGKAENWSAKQWAVLDEFQKLYLSQIDLFPEIQFDDALCMFASSGWSAEDLFMQISQWPIEKLVNQFWKDWCDCVNPSIWVTAFWADESAPFGFYTSKQILERITLYALDETTPQGMAEKACAVSDLLNTYSNQ